MGRSLACTNSFLFEDELKLANLYLLTLFPFNVEFLRRGLYVEKPGPKDLAEKSLFDSMKGF
jgi:hypothetical protein